MIGIIGSFTGLTADNGMRTPDLKQQILDSPHALRETLEKGRPEFESLVRRVPWGEGPIFMVGAGSSFIATLTGVHAFEGLLGWPVMARPSSDFEAYAVPVLRPRSVVLAVSNSGETVETLEAARAARTRGAVVLALTNNPASALAQMADLAFLLRAGAIGEPGLHTILCQQAALGYLSLVAARTLKRHHHQLDVLEEEYAKLPVHVEWIQTQLLDGVRALAAEVKKLSSLSLVGGGFYHPIALQAALLVRGISRIRAEGMDDGTFSDEATPPSPEDSAVLFLSGSHCRVKKKIHAMLARVRESGAKIFSVTDGNDRELLHWSAFSLLLPGLSEMVGSTLTLALLQSVAYQMTREPTPELLRKRTARQQSRDAS